MLNISPEEAAARQASFLAIKKDLAKKNLYVLFDNGHSYTVVWEDKAKVKLGVLGKKFSGRYGIDVWATWNGRAYWYKSGVIGNTIAGTSLCTAMEELFWGKDFTVNATPIDLDTLEISW